MLYEQPMISNATNAEFKNLLRRLMWFRSLRFDGKYYYFSF